MSRRKRRQGRNDDENPYVENKWTAVLERMIPDFEGERPFRFWRGSWWRWDSGRWQETSKEVAASAVEAWAYQNGHFPPHKLWADTKHFYRGAVTVPDERAMPSWDIPETGDPAWWLSGEDGILDLGRYVREKEIDVYSHTPSFFSDIRIPIAFNEAAPKPVKFLAFCDKVMEGDQERIQLLQEIGGYCLVSGNWKQRFFVLEGEGANGKTTFLTVLQQVLGESNCTKIPLSEIGKRFQLARTRGKLANLCPDEDEMTKATEGKIKAFSGGDRMYSDVKHKDGVDFLPTAKLIIDHNRRLRFQDKSHGFWRRMVTVPFLYTIPPAEKDDRYNTPGPNWIFKDELNGIFWWFVDGLRRLEQQGDFTIPEICKDAAEDYREENNAVELFLEEDVLVQRPGTTVPQQRVYTQFREWAQQNGFGAVSVVKFNRELKVWWKRNYNRELEVTRPSSGSGRRPREWVGVRLTEDPVQDAEDLNNNVREKGERRDGENAS